MLYGKIDRKELNSFINNKDNQATAKEVFGDKQPSIIQTGWYSAPSWNWSYQVGFCDVMVNSELQIFEVVTQFGSVEAARRVYFYNTK